MNITVIGTGYVGLVTAVCFAHWGHMVTCVEINEKKLAVLKAGRSPILENGVEEMMESSAERLKYTNCFKEACADTDAVFICVGTPEREDGYANLKQVFAVAEQVALYTRHDCVCAVKSTVPIGTNRKLEQLFAQNTREGAVVEVVSNPEFLSQGTAVRDFLSGPRVVIGAKSTKSREVMKEIYADYSGVVIITDHQTAEMIKYASNNYLALKLSFINEIANLCELVGANVETVAHGMGADRRIGEQFLRAGVGYGGSCFPKDTKALHWLARYHDYELKTVKAAIEVNENQRLRLIKKARRYYSSLEGLTVAILGLAFKPGTDDLRDAPSLQNIALLLQEGAHVRVWDASGYERIREIYSDHLTYCSTIEAALQDAHLCLILTEWRQVKELSPSEYARWMKKPIVIDGRNCYELNAITGSGIVYDSIGRPCVPAQITHSTRSLAHLFSGQLTENSIESAEYFESLQEHCL